MLQAIEAPKAHDRYSSKHSIFMIDDCEDMLTLGRIVLEQEGFEVFTATCASEALPQLGREKMPDLLLIDFYMRDMTGVELVKQLKQRMPALRDSTAIVFYSGVDREPAHDGDGFIRKSGDLSNFIKSVNSFIAPNFYMV